MISNSCYNSNTNLSFNQHKYSKRLDIPSISSVLSRSKHEVSPDLVKDPEKIIGCFTNTQKKTLDTIISFCRRYKTTYFTQDYLSSLLGISREWTNKLIKFLVSHGLVIKIYRHMTSCLYFLSPKFNDLTWTWSLRTTLNSLKLHIYSLVPALVHSIKEKNCNNYNLSIFSHLSFIRKGKKTMIETIKKNKILNEASCLLKTTPLGTCWLASYCDEALLFAIQRFKQAKKLSNPFSWFATVCQNFSKRNGFIFKPSISEDLIRYMELDRNGPLIELPERIGTTNREMFKSIPVPVSTRYKIWDEKEAQQFKGSPPKNRSCLKETPKKWLDIFSNILKTGSILPYSEETIIDSCNDTTSNEKIDYNESSYMF